MLFVIVSPSLAFLDQALPLAMQFKIVKPEEPIEFVFPKPKTTRQLNSKWLPVKIAESIGSKYHFPITKKVWVSASSAKQTRRISRVFDGLISVMERFNARIPAFLTELIDRTLLQVLKILRISGTAGFPPCASGPNWTLIDLHLVDKPYFDCVAKVVTESSILTIDHGPAPFQPYQVSNPSSAPWLKNRDGLRLVVCAQSVREVPLLVETFGFKESDVLVTGVPRHHSDWVEQISGASAQATEPARKDTILLNSRLSEPLGSFLTKNRKRRYLEAVREFASEHHLKILIKRHPTVTFQEGVYEQVLQRRDQGVTWDFTESHIFETPDTIVFSVSFGSSLCVDLLLRDVPTIQILDFSDLPQTQDSWATDTQLKDHPASVFEKFGLVVGVTSRADFVSSATRILREREEVLDGLQENYKLAYRYPPLSAATIVERLLR